jgi:bifunctional non-homologous end joining protein LigD
VALDDKGRPSFQLLQAVDMGMMRPPILFYAFDLLRLNGQDLRGLPIEERKAKLAELLKRPPPAIRFTRWHSRCATTRDSGGPDVVSAIHDWPVG